MYLVTSTSLTRASDSCLLGVGCAQVPGTQLVANLLTMLQYFQKYFAHSPEPRVNEADNRSSAKLESFLNYYLMQ